MVTDKNSVELISLLMKAVNEKGVEKTKAILKKGLEEGYYFVRVLSGGAIKLYESRALIETDGTTIDGDLVNNALGFLTNGTNSHTFILANQVSDTIHPQKLLKKFPHSQDIKTGKSTKTVPGSVGMLINGVEVYSYKSLDKIYYGPIEKITVYNTGKDYDVINPPNITVAAGLGTTAIVRSVVSGSVKEVLVDPQDFDVVNIFTAIAQWIKIVESIHKYLCPFIEKSKF